MTEKAYLDKIGAATKALGVYRVEFTRTRAVVSPEVAELDRLNDQALKYEQALGMTADSVRKINDNIFSPENTDPFAQRLAALARRRA